MEFGIDEGTVRNIFGEFAAEKEKTHSYIAPRILGIDEIHLNQVPCVLVDVGRRQIFNILRSRTKVHVAEYFAGMPDRDNVEVVVADMWKAYHALAEEFFPGRLVVVDKFHFLRMAHNGLDDVRKACGRQRTPEQRIKLKDERHLLHHRKAELNDGEREKVNAWLWEFPLLRRPTTPRSRSQTPTTRRAGAKASVRSSRASRPFRPRSTGPSAR